MSDQLRILRLESLLSKLFQDEVGVFVYQTLESTQDHARSLLELETVPFVVVAMEQTSGRGRQGRLWEGCKQGIYFTMVLPCNTGNSGFSLVAATAIHQACSVYRTLIIKWANDLLDGSGKKISGILVERIKDKFLVGIGLNLCGDNDQIGYLFDDEVDETLYLKIISDICLKLIDSTYYFEREGFTHFKNLWLEASFPIGRLIEYRKGDNKLKAEFNGVGDNGELLIKTESGEEIITTTEIDII